MKANFVYNDLDKLIDKNEDVAPLSESNETITSNEIAQNDISTPENTTEDDNRIIPNPFINNEESTEDYSDPYADEDNYEEEPDKKKLYIIIGSSIITIIILYFAINYFMSSSSASLPENTESLTAKKDSIPKIKTPVFSSNELSLISTKNNIINTVNSVFNSLEKNVIVEHIQISGTRLVIQFVSIDRAMIAKTFKKLENNNFLNDLQTTGSTVLGGSNQIKITISGNISSNTTLSQSDVQNNPEIISSITNDAQSNTVKVNETSTISNNLLYFSGQSSRQNMISYLKTFVTKNQNSSIEKVDLINIDRQNKSNANFKINLRIRALFPK